MSMGAAAVGGIVSGGFGVLSNYLAAKRQNELIEKQYQLNEKAANNADARTRALYEDYQSPEALLKQYQSAGLSPSLMFGGSGAGGGAQPASGAQGAGVSGQSPVFFGIDPMKGAQLGLIEAQSRKLNAEADTIEGKNERGTQEIQKLEADVSNTIAKTKNEGLKSAWYEYENALKMVDLQYESSVVTKRIESYSYECEHLKYRVRSAAVQAQVDEATKNNTIKLVDEQVKNVIADTLLKRLNGALVNAQKELTKKQDELIGSEIKVNEQQVQDLVSQIETRAKQVQINENELNQQIREWAVKNGIWTENNTNFGELLLKNLASEHTQDILVKLIQTLAK